MQELVQRINSNEIIALPEEPESILAQVKREAPCSSKMFVI
jgi:hypothetical protein